MLVSFATNCLRSIFAWNILYADLQCIAHCYTSPPSPFFFFPAIFKGKTPWEPAQDHLCAGCAVCHQPFSRISRLGKFKAFSIQEMNRATSTHKKDVLEFLSTYHSCGLSWAHSALKEALPMTMENPSLMIIQALESPKLYWVGIGNPKKGNWSHTIVLLDEKGLRLTCW